MSILGLKRQLAAAPQKELVLLLPNTDKLSTS
jgi:hypothetical protein